MLNICFTIWHEVVTRIRCIRVIELQIATVANDFSYFTQIHGHQPNVIVCYLGLSVRSVVQVLCQYMLNTMISLIMKRDNDRHIKKDCSWSVIEKHVVLTEVRDFGDPHIDKTRCLQIIKKLPYLLNQGEIFTKSEAAAILSSAVNLYRFQDVHLRRLFHLIARDLCPIADEVSLVTGALLKDVNTGNVAYRANAIRLLYHIMNDTSLNKVVKLLHEALCDENPTLQIASLVCSINMLKRDPRMVITIDQVYPEDTVFTKGKHVQFHAIYLEFVMGELRHTREVRRQRFYLIWEKFARLFSWCSSPLGTCILIRRIRQVARVRPVYWSQDIYECIQSCINAKDKMVAIEGFWTLEGVVGIASCIIEDNIGEV
ncbi:coatomer subunit gamma-like [Salvia splendens]|uniref:coatomer subunit gamma-like n=1 Tax=Salvia splendens TaxID=180675 RepID=UPI001C268AD8|nr:coatomer subunit gamma-like [Salvia splendens]